MTLALALATLFISFLAPPLYSGAVLALFGFVVAQRGLNVSNPLPGGSGALVSVFLVFAGLAVLGPSFNHGVSGQNVDAFKFLFAAAALLLGMMLGVEEGGVRRVLPLLLVAITLYYAGLYFTDAEMSQESLVYPPDNNHSASMLAVFLPLVVLRMNGGMRIACLALLLAFSFFSASRSLMALTLVAAALSSQTIRRQRLLMVLVLVLAGAVLFYRGFSMDNFSDRLRLQIVEASLNYAQTRGAYAFNFGEAAFADYLNIYPVYQRLEIQHAHNLLLQVWVAYGIVPFFVFSVFLVGYAVQAWRQRNLLALSAFAIFMALGMLEAIITDIRAFGTIVFALGYFYSRGASLVTGDSMFSLREAPQQAIGAGAARQ